MQKNKKVTIITPLLNEEDTIEIFYKTISKVVEKIKGFQFSFLFVDDGSKDKTWEALGKLAKKNNNISAIKLSRNFGSYVALPAGLETAFHKKNSDYFVMTTVDLQNPPELLPQLINRAKTGARIVFGTRAESNEGLSSFFSSLFWNLIRRFALPNAPKGGTDYCLIDNKVAGDIVSSGEKNSHIFNYILWLGYHQETIPFQRNKVAGRKSRWTLSKKIKLLVDTFVSFSYAPIRMVTSIGFSISLLGFLYATIIIIRRLTLGLAIEGWSSLMVVTLLISGIQLIMLGIVAEYLWRTFDSVRPRPTYLIDEEINT